MRREHHPLIRRALPVALPAVLALAAVLAACGVDKSGTDQPGLELARDSGCVACHSVVGHAGMGPTWKDLYGSTVTLIDGTKVKVDKAFLTRSIEDPSAQIEEGARAVMPTNRLTPDQVATIVNYIVTLSTLPSPDGTTTTVAP